MNASLIPAAVLAFTLASILVLRSRRMPVRLVCEGLLLALLLACLIARGTTPLPTAAELARHGDAVWLRALAVVWWLIGARVVAVLMVIALGHDARSRHARLFSDLLAAAIYLATALVILNSVLNLPVNGLLATSGVIAIVLGLALQNTLADVFSGIAVGIEQPFHVGDRVTIKDHAEGVVVEANWRSIRIQTEGEDIATVPNSIIARSQIINHSVPTERRAASIEIATRSSAHTTKLLELIRQASLLSPSVLQQPAPSISVKKIEARTVTLGIYYFAANTVEMANAKGQLLRQVRRLFRYAGVETGRPLAPADLLRQTSLFEMLSPDQLGRLAAALVHHGFVAGAPVFEQGTPGASLYVVGSGIFKVTRRDGERQVDLGRIGSGEYLGEVSMMTGNAHPVTLTAETEGEMLELPKAAIEDILRDDPGFGAVLERSVERGLQLLDRDEAARTCDPLDRGGAMLTRIQNFLHRRLGT